MPASASEPEQHQQAIRADKILLVHRNMPLMLVGNLLGCLPLAVILLNAGYGTMVFIWLGAIYLLSLVRWFHYWRLPVPVADRQRIFRQEREYIIFALVSGAIWGSTGVLFFNPDAVGQFTFLFLTLFAMISGSMTALSARPLNYLAYALPAMLPISINLFLQDTVFYFWMGVASLVYLVLTLVMSHNMHRSLSHSLMLKYENIDLLEDLQQQTEAAHRANRDKSRFLAAASHDLRQPLHAVNLFVEGLDAKLTTAQQVYDMEHIRHGLNSLSELFDALLDISRMDAGSLPVNKVDFRIDPLLHRLADQFAPEAEGKGLRLTVSDCDHIVYSDPVLLERMLRNLLSNAIRYTERGEVRIACQEAHDHHLQISIVDTGPGIPEQNRDDIFSEFFQLQNPERDRSKGLGLGLAIVRRLSRLLGHVVELHSSLGKGSEFTLQVPMGEGVAMVTDISAVAVAENRLENLQVLVIDNETEILEAMCTLLEGWQCRFTGIESACVALKRVEEGLRPGFIVSDYRLPGKLNGCELVQQLREIAGNIPALLISGDTSEAIIRQAKDASLIMLTKPVKPAQLRLAMMRQLKTQGNRSGAQG
ncbi:MAG TPA: response regulator [Gammaproteobacteria bacterium]|nr:response regulator [Gammaproteobacteria bacterium]